MLIESHFFVVDDGSCPIINGCGDLKKELWKEFLNARATLVQTNMCQVQGLAHKAHFLMVMSDARRQFQKIPFAVNWNFCWHDCEEIENLSFSLLETENANNFLPKTCHKLKVTMRLSSKLLLGHYPLQLLKHFFQFCCLRQFLKPTTSFSEILIDICI